MTCRDVYFCNVNDTVVMVWYFNSQCYISVAHVTLNDLRIDHKTLNCIIHFSVHYVRIAHLYKDQRWFHLSE